MLSGGWVGWDWWSYAPQGRPHLYPPFYHLILVLLKFCGISGINSVIVSEFFILPVFFLVIWITLSKIAGKRVSFFTLFLLSGFLPFYASITENIPASLAIIFGFLSLYLLKKKNWIRSAVWLGLAFYTSTNISLIFAVAYLWAACFDKQSRPAYFKVTLFAFLAALPFLMHQLKYLNYLNIRILKEAGLSRLNLFVFLTALPALFFLTKDKQKLPVFSGLLLGSIIIFARYPYRLLCAQGLIGAALLSSYTLEKIWLTLDKPKQVAALLSVLIYIAFFNVSIGFQGDKITASKQDAAYYRIFTGRIYEFLKFKPILTDAHSGAIVSAVRDNSCPFDIIGCNIPPVSQVFGALTQRPSLGSIPVEIKADKAFDPENSKIFIRLKIEDTEKQSFLLSKGWEKITENGIAEVFLNKNNPRPAQAVKSKVSFIFIWIIFLLVIILYIKNPGSASKTVS
jgi:hypothetical protein